MTATRRIPAAPPAPASAPLAAAVLGAAAAAALAWTALSQGGPAAPQAPPYGLFPALSLVPHLVGAASEGLSAAGAAAIRFALALLALGGAAAIWARRFSRAGHGPVLAPALILPPLLLPLVAQAILRDPGLAFSFLAGTLVVASLGRPDRVPSDAALFRVGACILAAWMIDDVFWAALPGCAAMLLALSPAPVRSRSVPAIAVIALFPVAAALASALFVACVYLGPASEGFIVTGYESRAGTIAALGIGTAGLAAAAFGLLGCAIFLVAAFRPAGLPGIVAVAALPFSACLVGWSLAGPDGLLAATPMMAVLALELVRSLRAAAPGEAPGIAASAAA